ncbi:MAG TPA: hypothetical protein VGM29_18995 [Polyangiaceae bacterium]|jgi:hypothetical protein
MSSRENDQLNEAKKETATEPTRRPYEKPRVERGRSVQSATLGGTTPGGMH